MPRRYVEAAVISQVPYPRLTPADSGPLSVADGQTETDSGIIRGSVTLGSAAMLTEPGGAYLSIFGDIAGPAVGTGTLEIAAGATLYAAGAVASSVATGFAAPGGTLQLADLYLPEMAGAITGFSLGDAVDIVSGVITDAVLAPSGNGTSLTLLDEGVAVAILTLADPQPGGDAAFAVTDPIDGTRIMLGAYMPSVSGAAPAGTATGAAFVWGASPTGQWADSGAWRAAGGDPASLAPGARDRVTIAGPQASVLTLAGNGAAASLATQGLIALAGSFVIGTLSVGAASSDALLLTSGCSLTAATATLAAGVLQVQGSGATLDTTGTATLGSGVLWVADGGTVGAQVLLLAGGTVRIGTAGAVSVGGAAESAGIATIATGGLLSGNGVVRAPVWNNGTVQAAGGALAIYGVLSGTGVAQVDSGSELYLPDGAAAGQTIAFAPRGGAAGGTLELFGSAQLCAATITGFGVGDVVDIASATLSQAAWTPPAAGDGTIGVLSLGGVGTLEIGLAAGFDPGQAQFQLAADGLGGTAITIVPCFAAGTRLATTRGDVAVEDIAVGDRLLTRAGAVRQVRWIGRRAYDAATLRAETQLRPVRIRAGALAPGSPGRDLLLSPQHGVALATPSGLRLVPAVALVDGRRIHRELPESGVSYVHVELERHDLLLAEGVAVESFLANGPERRSLFQQVSGTPTVSGESCCSRLEDGAALAALRRDLGLREPVPRNVPHSGPRGSMDGAKWDDGFCLVEGWAMQEGGPVWLEVLIDGAVCGHVLANRWRPDLDKAGLKGGSCGFSAGVTFPGGRAARRITVRGASKSAGLRRSPSL